MEHPQGSTTAPESTEAKTPGHATLSRKHHYAKFEPLVQPAIERLRELLKSKNEPTVIGALKLIFERTIPAIKAMEITGDNGEPIRLNIINAGDYISAIGKLTTAPGGSATYGPPTLQSSNMAQESKEDDNSNKPDSEVVST